MWWNRNRYTTSSTGQATWNPATTLLNPGPAWTQAGSALDLGAPAANEFIQAYAGQGDVSGDVDALDNGAAEIALGVSLEPLGGPAKTAADVRLGSRVFNALATDCALGSYSTTPLVAFNLQGKYGEGVRLRRWIRAERGSFAVGCCRNVRVDHRTLARRLGGLGF